MTTPSSEKGRADQRADTPLGLREALAALLEDSQHVAHNCGDPDCPVDKARDALAAAEPAAAEPMLPIPDEDEFTRGYRLGNRDGIEFGREQEHAGQPPRGNLPDPRPEEIAAVEEQVRLLQEGVPNVHVRLAGGSLTATEPPQTLTPDEQERFLGRGITNVSSVSVRPRGVTPALDVPWLAKALEHLEARGDFNIMDDGDYAEFATRIADEYARLGSPEDSDA